MKELKLKREPNVWDRTTLSSDWTGPRGITVCNTDLRRAVDLPRGATNITVVFSKNKRVNDFDVVQRGSNMFGRYGVDSRDFDFMSGARRELRAMYTKGYRHVRVEY